jgi:putative transposase
VTRSADFKGNFKMGDSVYCYPPTLTDDYSRYLLGCQALYSTAAAGAKPVFTRLFKEYGLPKRTRTDNGAPFATNTLARLVTLSAWWVRLGGGDVFFRTSFIRTCLTPTLSIHGRLSDIEKMQY